MDVAKFRAVLPEFSDATAYPDAQIQFNIDLATASLLPSIWGDRIEFGILYYAAHYVALSGSRAPAYPGGPPAAGGGSAATGLVSSKSVGGISISFDTSTGQTDGGGSFNLTRYGQEYLTLRDSVAIGAMQL